MVVVVGCSDDEIQMVHGIKQATLVDSTEQNYSDYMYNDAMRSPVCPLQSLYHEECVVE